MYSNVQGGEMKIIVVKGNLAMVPTGRSNDEAMVLDAVGDHKFKMTMAGINIEFFRDKKMKFKMGEREIIFDLIPPPPKNK